MGKRKTAIGFNRFISGCYSIPVNGEMRYRHPQQSDSDLISIDDLYDLWIAEQEDENPEAIELYYNKLVSRFLGSYQTEGSLSNTVYAHLENCQKVCADDDICILHFQHNHFTYADKPEFWNWEFIMKNIVPVIKSNLLITDREKEFKKFFEDNNNLTMIMGDYYCSSDLRGVKHDIIKFLKLFFNEA